MKYDDPNFAKFILQDPSETSSEETTSPHISFCSTQNNTGDKRFITVLSFRYCKLTKAARKANRGNQEYFEFGDIIDKDKSNSDTNLVYFVLTSEIP